MHEQAIVNDIIYTARNQGDVLSISIEVGELAPIDANHLKKDIVERTHWSVHTYPKAAKVTCPCGYEGRPRIEQRHHDKVVYKCPKCGDLMPRIIEGDRIILKEVKVK